MTQIFSRLFGQFRNSNSTKKSLYLHIGMGKTGTTALQVFFSGNRKAMEKQGVAYPRLGEIEGAHHLLSPHVPRFLRNTWKFKSVDDWAPELATTDVDSILLSSELMSRATPNELLPFCESIMKWFVPKVVIYVRRQDDIIMASYNQHIKSGLQKRQLTDVYQKMIPKFDYEALLSPWEDVVGRENIIVRPYEKVQFFDGDLRKDFLKNVLGINVHDSFTFDRTNPNPSLTKVPGEYLRMINNVVADPARKERFRDLLLDLTLNPDKRVDWPRNYEPYLPKDIRRAIIRESDASNLVIVKKYMDQGDRMLFLDPVPEGTDTWEGNRLPQQMVSSLSAYLAEKDPELILWLARELPQYLDDETYVVRSAARMLTSAL